MFQVLESPGKSDSEEYEVLEEEEHTSLRNRQRVRRRCGPKTDCWQEDETHKNRVGHRAQSKGTGLGGEEEVPRPAMHVALHTARPILVESRTLASRPGFRAEARRDPEIPEARQAAVKAGALWKSVGVWAGLKEPSLLIVRAEATSRAASQKTWPTALCLQTSDCAPCSW